MSAVAASIKGYMFATENTCAPALSCLAAATLCSADGMSAIAASIEGYIRATKESSGDVVTVLKQGYLLKRSSGMRREWKRRFFVLDSLGCLYYYSNKVTAFTTTPTGDCWWPIITKLRLTEGHMWPCCGGTSLS